MKKVILATVVAAGVLATTAFAYNQDCQNQGKRGMQKQGMQQQGMGQKSMQYKSQKMSHKGKGMHGSKGGMQMLSQLNLSDDQKFQMSILRDENKLAMKKLRGPQKRGQMMKFVGEGGFDKAAFKKEANAKHLQKMELKAAHMEKVFKLLTKEQIAELKTKLAG